MRTDRTARKYAGDVADGLEADEDADLPYHVVEAALMEKDEFVHAVAALDHATTAGDVLRRRDVDIRDARREQLSRAEVAASDAVDAIVGDVLDQLRERRRRAGGESA